MPNIDHHRKAAISIYFLNEKDQKWLLSNLNARDTQRIADCLEELKALAIPRDQITKKTILSYLDIPLDDDLYGLLTEILNKDSALLVNFINEEPSWLGNYLMNEYPALFDTVFKSRLSKHKLSNINHLSGRNRPALTAMARRAVLKSAQDELMKKYLDTQPVEGGFAGFIEKYESMVQEG